MVEVAQSYSGVVSVEVAQRVPPCDSYGDVDNDGYVSLNDLSLIEIYLSIGWVPPVSNVPITESEFIRRADIDGDGVIGQSDLDAIWNYVAEVQDTFPVCEAPPPMDAYCVLATISQPNGIGNADWLEGTESGFSNVLTQELTRNASTSYFFKLYNNGSSDARIYIGYWNGSEWQPGVLIDGSPLDMLAGVSVELAPGEYGDLITGSHMPAESYEVEFSVLREPISEPVPPPPVEETTFVMGEGGAWLQTQPDGDWVWPGSAEIVAGTSLQGVCGITNVGEYTGMCYAVIVDGSGNELCSSPGYSIAPGAELTAWSCCFTMPDYAVTVHMELVDEYGTVHDSSLNLGWSWHLLPA